MKNLLKVKRWEASIKQYELANLLGCSASYLSMIENGRIEPTDVFKTKAAMILKIEGDVLFPNSILKQNSLLAKFI